MPSRVFQICNSYESGYGHGLFNSGMGLSRTPHSDPELGEAYQLGYEAGHREYLELPHTEERQMQITKTVLFQLTMTEKEADWLKGEMQNSPPGEDEESCKIRRKFFFTLLTKQNCDQPEE